MAKIVVAKNSLPYPPTFGTDVVTYQLLKAIAAAHEVTLVAAVVDDGWRQHVDALRAMGIELVPVMMPNKKSAAHRVFFRVMYGLLSAITLSPREAWYFNFPTFRAAVQKAAATADLVQLEYWYLYPTGRALSGVKKVLMKLDAEFVTNRRDADEARSPWARLHRIARYHLRRRLEAKACRIFDEVLCISSVDAAMVQPFCPRPPRVVFPIVELPDASRLCRGFDRRTLVYFGNLRRGVNLQGLLRFLDHVYPRVRSAVPDVRLILRGEPPPPALRARAARDDSIELQAFGDDLPDVLENATATIVPLWIGSGIKIKVLTALSHGVPVVTTPVGAEGIAAEPGSEVLIGSSDEEIANHCITLLTDAARWNELARGARRYAERELDPAVRHPQIASLYAELAG
jgi:glycosyltransferase involved in cell wall biosynthesis